MNKLKQTLTRDLNKLNIHDKVSINDLEPETICNELGEQSTIKDDDPKDQVYYDAFDKLEEYYDCPEQSR